MPLVFTWPLGAVFWGIYVALVAPEARLLRRRARPGTLVDDRGSLAAVLVSRLAAGVAGAALAIAVPAAAMPGPPAAWLAAGLLLLACGSALRHAAVRVLGQDFTPTVGVRAGQPIVTRGLYARVRHPSYAGGLLMLAGFGLALGHWLALVAVPVVGGAGYAYRIRVEERLLLGVLGEAYAAYMRRTRRLIPFLW